MTEEIIINGVNVAGCYWKCKDGDCAMYYADLSADNNELEFGFNCEDNPDCYYKQLQRLKQENEKLRNRVKELEDCEDIFYQENQDNRKYIVALEEIWRISKSMIQGVSSNCIKNTPYLTALYSIETRINEVLG